MKKVYVVTNSELGWDCVVGVFDAEVITEEQLEERFQGCYIDERNIEINLENWD